ncbi:uncharacterized protein N7506_005293 [Penicillium brevicompactum]|uniref:uncharacterized protein n=1 Tax=Penicillium brevicompactum TaxID=5074 RepID=UPI002540E6FA|nr:uncharacterized protein N7506_005293 [Penicillium brevicompactum]KAJ5337271.1 hypothetical protein N7506_005293 [Penicillium brevicompactum]
MPHDADLWTAWVSQNIPPDVVKAGVTAEVVARGSCMLVLNVPVEVWTMLPRDDRTYTFIAHVSSGLTPISHQSFSLPILLALGEQWYILYCGTDGWCHLAEP